jgi:pimeloyl-[acyl-carrier protein] methyl ester esterase
MNEAMAAAAPVTAVLLPGIDGTGRMFGPLLAHLPVWMTPRVIAYPGDRNLSYAQLVEEVLPKLPATQPYLVIAESFAGPLALQLSTRAGANLRALVLCATFVRNPRPHLARLAPLLLRESVLAHPPEKWLARLFVTGFDAPDWMLEQALTLHRQVSPRVILHRLYEVIHVDVAAVLRHCRLPILHLYALHDHLILQRATREIQQLRPDITSIGIDGPHYLLQTRPQACVAAIETFVREELTRN